jgi:hypothetical protein
VAFPIHNAEKEITLMARLNLKTLEAQRAAGLEGIWHPYLTGAEKEGDTVTEFKIARTGKQFQAFVQGKLASVRKMKRGADIEDALLDPRMEPVYREAYARFVLLDWKHLDGGEGSDVPYSVEIAEQLLLDQEVFAFIRVKSGEAVDLREAAQEDDAGNSSAT